MSDWIIRLLETPDEMQQVEQLQRLVWPGSDIDVTPSHLLLTIAHNGGPVLGAYIRGKFVGLLFGFPRLEQAPARPPPQQFSPPTGARPDFPSHGSSFPPPPPPWQIVPQQGRH